MFFELNENKLVISLDYDGCLDNNNLAARQYLIQHLVDILKDHPQITELEILVGSTRSYAFTYDFYTSYLHNRVGKPHDSCATLKEIFLDQLQTALLNNGLDRVKLHFDEVMMADILSDFEHGSCFKFFQQARLEYERWSAGNVEITMAGPNLKQKNTTVFATKLGLSFQDPITVHGDNHLKYSDTFKLLMLYMQMQEQALKKPLGHFVFNFYDDRGDITQNAWRFFKKCPFLIPKNCRLRIDPLNFSHGITPFDRATAEQYTINGTGELNLQYADDIRTVAEHLTTVTLPSDVAATAFLSLKGYIDTQNIPFAQAMESYQTISRYLTVKPDRSMHSQLFSTAADAAARQEALTRLNEALITEIQQKIDQEVYTAIGQKLVETHQLRFAKPPVPTVVSPLSIIASSTMSQGNAMESNLTDGCRTIIPFSTLGQRALEL